MRRHTEGRSTETERAARDRAREGERGGALGSGTTGAHGPPLPDGGSASGGALHFDAHRLSDDRESPAAPVGLEAALRCVHSPRSLAALSTEPPRFACPVPGPGRLFRKRVDEEGTHAFEGFGVAGGRRGRGRGLGGQKKKAVRCSPKLESNKRPIDLDDNRGATELSGLAFSVFSTRCLAIIATVDCSTTELSGVIPFRTLDVG